MRVPVRNGNDRKLQTQRFASSGLAIRGICLDCTHCFRDYRNFDRTWLQHDLGTTLRDRHIRVVRCVMWSGVVYRCSGIQRLAIPEASPTLPLAASLGVTFSYNVTIGIPVYIMIATILTRIAPVVVT